MENREELYRLREEMATLEQGLRHQYAQLQQLQQRLHQLDPSAIAKPPQGVKARRRGSLENFIGLKLMHLVGIVVLVIGLAIGVKYAFDRNLISELTRIMLAYAAGGILLVLSWRLYARYGLFSAILFSGAMATIYFTSYAAHVYYGLLPFGAVFGFMVLLTLLTALVATRYNRPEIALLGLVGAYAIPFLISRNAEQADLFFLYITIINCGVLYLRIRRQWAVVGRVALLLTWTLFVGWSTARYTEPQFVAALLFLFVFFLLFSVMELATPGQAPAERKPEAHMQLLNNIGLFWGGLFIMAPGGDPQQMAQYALGCAVLAAAQVLLLRRTRFGHAYLELVLSLYGCGLLVVAAGWYFEGFPVTLIWLLLSVGLFGLGAGLRARIWRLAALGLMALTLLKLLVVDSQRFTAGQKVIAYLALGLLLLVVSFFYQKFRQRWFGEEEA